MLKKVCLPLLFLIVSECSRIGSRQNVAGSLKREPSSKIGKRAVGRGEAFENLFQIYDPSFLAVVWPKISNGVHLLLEVQCWDDIKVFFKDFSDGKAWAYRAVDSSGRYPSAFLSGSRYWLGSKEQCLRINHAYPERTFNTSWVGSYEYNFAKAALRREKYFENGALERTSKVYDDLAQKVPTGDQPPHTLAYSTVQVSFNITKPGVAKATDIILGVCLPQSCEANDIKSIINFSILINDKLKSNRTLARSATITSVRKIESYDFKRDVGAILIISITIVLIILAIVATAIDLDIVKCLPCNKTSMSFDLEKYNRPENKTIGKENKVRDELKGFEKPRANLALPNNSATDFMTIKKCYTVPLPIAPVVTFEEKKTGCKRCGKYKQCGSAREIINLSAFPREKHSFPEYVVAEERKSLLCRLFLCFSLIYSWKRIFNKNTANKDLVFIHVLKVVATFWVIFVHVSVMVDHVSDDAGDINEHNNVYYIIMSGTIAFDTLFFVSGLLSSHHFFYLKSRYSIEELVNFGGTCGQILQVICFIINRVIRMLPSYAYAILLAAVVARVARDTAVLTLPDNDHKNCDTYWWRNILYVSNMYPDNEQCMQVSWYLSTETQLHAVGALACAASVSASVSARVLANTRAKLVAAMVLVVLLAATAVDICVSYIDDGLLFSNAYAAYSAIIDRPWARITPYFIGVFAGWLVHAMKGRIKVSKVTCSILWVVSMSLVAACAWAARAGRAGAGAALHALWPGALLWPLFATVGVVVCGTSTRRARARAGAGLAALGRLCGAALLLHGAAARALLLAAGSALCDRTVCLWTYFAATSVVTVLASLVLALVLETPCCSLLRVVAECAV